MNKLAFVAFLIASLSALQGDYKVCTEDSKAVVDDLFIIVEDFEKDPLNPPAQHFKDLLKSLETLLADCADVHVDLSRYGNCVDDLIAAFPQIKKLITDIKNNDTSAIMIDVTTLALQLMNGLQKCAKPKGTTYASIF